jgi:uncharacterized delta-60 repeat protein
MSDFDPLVSAELDAQVPSRPDRRPAWDDVLARAGVARVTGSQQTTTTWLPRWQWRRVILAFALVVVGVVVTGSALATLGVHPLGGLSAPAGHRHGSLDTSFGRGGKVMTRIGSGGASASALAIRKDGKLVAAGTNNTGPIDGGGYNRFALVRYHANGTLDTSFGRGGRVTTTIGPGGGAFKSPGGAVASAVAIQQDGKLVAAGGTHDVLDSDFALARYNANGTLDRSFGRGGIVTTCCSGAFALAIQQDGKLVAAGGSDNGFALVRYHANGTLDRSFGRGGKVTTPLASGGAASALAIQQDGKLVAAGTTQCCFGGDLALVRYNANGTLDTSFGRGGIVKTPLGSGDADPPVLAIQQDGKLVAAAGSRSNNRLVLVRYNANGTLDRSFGRGGKVTTPIAPSGIGGLDGRSALAIQQDGKLVAAGRSNNRFALVRYNANGTLDTSFGRGGKVTTPTGGVSALAIQQDGKLVAAGGSDNGFALVRYWP